MNTTMQVHERTFEEAVSDRQSIAHSLSLDEKANQAFLQIEEEFTLPSWHFIARERRQDEPLVGRFDDTLLYLSGLGLRYKVDPQPELITTASKILDVFEQVNEELKGHVPHTVRETKDGELIVSERPRMNLISQMLAAYATVRMTFDSGITERFGEYCCSVLENLIMNDFVLKESVGVPAPKSTANLRPRYLFPNPSRRLDALLIFEAGQIIFAHDDSIAELLSNMKEEAIGKYHDGNTIQKTIFKIGTINYPSHSSRWLDLMKLHALVSLNPEDVYVSALERLYQSQKTEMNPLYGLSLVHALGNERNADCTPRIIEDMTLALRDFPFPMKPFNPGEPSYKMRHPKRRFKLKRIAEFDVAPPLYARPASYNEWKHNAFRCQYKHDERKHPLFSGVDYLHAFWMLQNVNKQIKP